MNDDQVPCSGWSRQRVRLETEQPIWLIQVPWITWSSSIADGRYREVGAISRSGHWVCAPCSDGCLGFREVLRNVLSRSR